MQVLFIFWASINVATSTAISDRLQPKTSTFTQSLTNKKYSFFVKNSEYASKTKCAIICNQDILCQSFQYNENTGSCTTHSVSFEGNVWEVDAKDEVGNDVFSKVNSHALGTSCTSGADCDVINSTCVNAACVCSLGYSYSQSENICVLGCTKYGSEMTMYHGNAIQSYNINFLWGVSSFDDCVSACLAEPDPICVSVDYSPRYRQCATSAIGFLEAPVANRLFDDPDWLHGARDCAT